MREDHLHDSSLWPSPTDLARHDERGRQLRSGALLAISGTVVHALARWFVEGVVRPLERRREASRTYAALMALDDRMLEDIGISRSDVPSIAIGAWEHPEDEPTVPGWAPEPAPSANPSRSERRPARVRTFDRAA